MYLTKIDSIWEILISDSAQSYCLILLKSNPFLFTKIFVGLRNDTSIKVKIFSNVVIQKKANILKYFKFYHRLLVVVGGCLPPERWTWLPKPPTSCRRCRKWSKPQPGWTRTWCWSGPREAPSGIGAENVFFFSFFSYDIGMEEFKRKYCKLGPDTFTSWRLNLKAIWVTAI